MYINSNQTSCYYFSSIFRRKSVRYKNFKYIEKSYYNILLYILILNLNNYVNLMNRDIS